MRKITALFLLVFLLFSCSSCEKNDSSTVSNVSLSGDTESEEPLLKDIIIGTWVYEYNNGADIIEIYKGGTGITKKRIGAAPSNSYTATVNLEWKIVDGVINITEDPTVTAFGSYIGFEYNSKLDALVKFSDGATYYRE